MRNRTNIINTSMHVKTRLLAFTTLLSVLMISSMSVAQDETIATILQTPVAETVASDIELSVPLDSAEPAIGGIALAESDQFASIRTCKGPDTIRVAGKDEVWLVSAREFQPGSYDVSSLRVERLTGGCWEQSSLDALTTAHATDKQRTTMIYAHGNLTNLVWAKSRGLQVYRNAIRENQCGLPPMRYVIFAWKSERELPRLAKDFGIKAQRAADVGQAFGLLLEQFEDRQIVLMGFSLGAQVAMSGLEELRQHCPLDHPETYRLAIVAPALEPNFICDALAGFFDNPLVRKTDVFLNRNDRVIKAAELLVKKKYPACAPVLRELSQNQSADTALNMITVQDITLETSRMHSIVRYTLTPTLQRVLAEMVNEFR